MKKAKNLLINLKEVIETNADIIKLLMKMNKNQIERKKTLEKGINDLKIGRVKKKEEKKRERNTKK